MKIYVDAGGSIGAITFEGDVSPRQVKNSMRMWCARACLLGRRAHVPTWSPVCAAHKHCGTDLQCARIPGQPSVHEQGLLAHNYASTPGTNAHMCMRAWPVQTVQYERNPNTVTQPASHPPTASQGHRPLMTHIWSVSLPPLVLSDYQNNIIIRIVARRQ